MGHTHTYRTDGAGTTETRELSALQAIRLQCRECMGFQRHLVAGCTSVLCSLYPFRLGASGRKEMAEEQRAAAGERLRRLRDADNAREMSS
jgi:hypothetical protein